MKRTKGFTLIELIMVIVILGILAAVAIPQLAGTLTARANTSAEQGVVGGIRAGIAVAYAEANPPAWPASLDSAAVAACATANACFDTVLAQGGITSDWTKTAATIYTGPAAGSYTYTAATGTFQ